MQFLKELKYFNGQKDAEILLAYLSQLILEYQLNSATSTAWLDHRKLRCFLGRPWELVQRPSRVDLEDSRSSGKATVASKEVACYQMYGLQVFFPIL